MFHIYTAYSTLTVDYQRKKSWQIIFSPHWHWWQTGQTKCLYSPDFSPPPSSPWPSSGRTSSCSPPPPRPPPDTPGSTSALLLLPLRIEDKSINLFPDWENLFDYLPSIYLFCDIFIEIEKVKCKLNLYLKSLIILCVLTFLVHPLGSIFSFQ